MTYDLPAFCAELHTILARDGQAGLPEIAEKLKALLVNPDFVAATWTDETPPGKQVLYHDEETDAYVLAHVQAPAKTGTPHSHGTSWAIYGNARGYTEMTEWKRVNAAQEDHAVLTATARYRLGPGDSHAYGSGVIHSTAHPEKAWVVRVTGTDLDVLPRYRFKASTDRILQNA